MTLVTSSNGSQTEQRTPVDGGARGEMRDYRNDAN